jgi:hypothetical protein
MGKLIYIKDIAAQKSIASKKKSIPKSAIESNSKSLSILKVTVSDFLGKKSNKQTYRVISIPTSYKLDKLALAVLDSFDFDMDHMYGFYDNLKNWSRSTESYIMEEEDAYDFTGYVTKTTIGEAFDVPKKKMLFLFDFGDEWRFIIELQRVEPVDGKTKLAAKVIESKGEAPEQYPDFEA